MAGKQDGSLIIQSDLTILLDERRAEADQARELLLAFADVVKRSGVIHTYRVTPMTVWNALSSGMKTDTLLDGLERHARFGVPAQAETALRLWSSRYGSLKLRTEGDKLVLCGEQQLLEQLANRTNVAAYMTTPIRPGEWELKPAARGDFKRELVKLGYPVLDHAGYHEGESLPVALREVTLGGSRFQLRDYQRHAVDRLLREGGVHGGSGVVVLPCGTGKTIVGIAALASMGSAALILTSSVASAQQWRAELLDKTTLSESQIGLYGGQMRQVRPVTIGTYNLLTHRKTGSGAYPHMKLFSDRDWGLIVYDEVQLLPAPVFRMTATLQATRRLGLTATLVREDGCADDVYSLIGPKLYDMHWKSAEEQAYIASVNCTEIRVPLGEEQKQRYNLAGPRAKLRLAAENPDKLTIVEQLLGAHAGKPTLVIGQYLDQLNEAASRLNAPLLTGEVPHQERQRIYDEFRAGGIKVLVVSKVANLAVDLPDAAVAIQLSGSFGSRQEEAQRIGRLLRPKDGANEAWFYTLVTDGTRETDFALKRQLFMLEQGYRYEQRQAQESRALESGEEALL